MSDSGEAETSEQEFKSQEGGTTTTSNKRRLDEYLINENESFGTVKNVAKSAARKLDFERTEEDEDLGNQISGLESLKRSAKPTARKLEFRATEDDDDVLPLACSICRKPFLDPVVTNCNHYFCNLCALKHHETNNNCFVCDKPTLGVFNTAVEIKKKIAKVRQKAKAMVKEVLTIVEKAAVISKNADAMTAESTEIVEEVETMVGIVEAHGEDLAVDPSSWDSVIKLVENVEVLAAKASEMAEKAAEMVKEANAMTETARAEMAKAFLVMKNVKWNV